MVDEAACSWRGREEIEMASFRWGSKAMTLALCGIGLIGLSGGSGCKSDPPPGPICTAGVTDCAGTAVARVCAPDGSGWISAPCPGGSTCSAGTCAGPCTKGQTQCADDRVALACSPDQASWLSITCRSDEKCDSGMCKLDPSAVACVAGKTDCVTNAIGRACMPDGSAWVPFTCSTGFKCDQGACVFDGGVRCTPGTGACVEGAPYRCKADGSGYDAAVCASGTTCMGAGQCMGAVCAVGTTRCSGSGAWLESCPDGTAWVKTPCEAGKLCIDASQVAAPGYVAACLPAGCTPGAATVCGSPTDPSLDATTAYSACAATPSGYAWQATKCATFSYCSPSSPSCRYDCQPSTQTCSTDGRAIVTCNASGKLDAVGAQLCAAGRVCVKTLSGAPACGDSACANGVAGACTADGKVRACDASGTLDPATQATVCATGVCSRGACIAECTNGSQRCTTLADGSAGVQVCANDTWGKSLAQTCSTPTAPSLACFVPTAGQAVCGDTQCAMGGGVCTVDGRLRGCDSGGHLASDAQAAYCPAGTYCSGGSCVAATCQPGESICVGGNAVRACDNGQWSATYTPCSASADGGLQTCTNTGTTPSRSAICGIACAPGARQCVVPPGSVAGDPTTWIQVCSAGGQWGASQACAAGACGGSAPSAACSTQCIPGRPLCSGTRSYLPELGQYGASQSGTCTSAGALPTAWATCGAGTSCRLDPSGNAFGCVQCVGGRNEYGISDTRCSGIDGGVSTSYETCSLSNNWVSNVTYCNGASCIAPSASRASTCAPPNACVACVQSNCTNNACTSAVCLSAKAAMTACFDSTCLYNAFYLYYYNAVDAGVPDAQARAYALCEYQACYGGACP